MEFETGGTLDFVSLDFKIMHDGCTTALTNDVKDLVIRMLYCHPFRDRGYNWVVVEAKAKDQSLLAKYVGNMRKHGRVRSVLEVKHDVKNSSVRLSLIEGYEGMISSLAYEMGAVQKQETVQNGEETWRVVLPTVNRDIFVELINLYGKVVNFRATRLDHHDPVEIASRLTNRERDIIRIAYDLGYFEFPKSAHLKDIARKTNLSIPTINEYIRCSQRKILAFFIENFTT